MTMSDETLDRLLKTDPLGDAEKITGKDYHDAETTAIGFGILREVSAKKTAILWMNDDTLFRNKLDRYVEIIEKNGFEQVLDIPFLREDRICTEHLFVYANTTDGLLLVFDTYMGDDVSGGSIYYNWIPNEGVEIFDFISSGFVFKKSREHYDDDIRILAGSHDCREALIYNMQQLRANGTFLTTWDEHKTLWLIHHGDNKYDCYSGIINERIAMLPDNIKHMIGHR
jgi:hypothetical protein